MAALVVVLSGAVTGWLLVLGPAPLPGRAPDAAAETSAGAVEGPHLVSLEELRRAASVDGPVYWAGARPDQRYELTRTSSGAVYVRYLPAGVSAGSDDAHLTVATYPQQQGAAYLEAAATQEGVRSWRTASGAFVVVDPRAPLSTYFSFEDVDFQVEVYSPTPGSAEQLVLSGAVSGVPRAGGGDAGGSTG